MTKKQMLQKLNKQIDDLILKGKDNTPEYQRLCQLHRKIRNA